MSTFASWSVRWFLSWLQSCHVVPVLVLYVQSVVPFLVEGLTELAIQRPQDPLLWLSQYILDRSPAGGEYKIVPAKCVSADQLFFLFPFFAGVLGFHLACHF